MPDFTFKTFPDNETEALAMLWLQNQDLSSVTPEELLEKYQDACDKIRERKKQQRQTKRGARGLAF